MTDMNTHPEKLSGEELIELKMKSLNEGTLSSAQLIERNHQRLQTMLDCMKRSTEVGQ